MDVESGLCLPLQNCKKCESCKKGEIGHRDLGPPQGRWILVMVSQSKVWGEVVSIHLHKEQMSCEGKVEARRECDI